MKDEGQIDEGETDEGETDEGETDEGQRDEGQRDQVKQAGAMLLMSHLPQQRAAVGRSYQSLKEGESCPRGKRV